MYFRGLSGTRKPLKTLAFFGYLVVQGLHRREEEDIADGGAVGKQHDQAVDAEAQAARGGHAVFQRGDVSRSPLWALQSGSLRLALGDLAAQSAPSGRWGRSAR